VFPCPSSIVSAGDRAVDLWLARLDQAREPQLVRAYQTLLSADERVQQQRFYFERDRHRYLVTRALVRTVLSQYAPVRPEKWTFTAGRYGRPEIANHSQETAGLGFNVSHTEGLVVLAVAVGLTVGVDTEWVRDRLAPLDVAGRYFSRAESRALSALPPDERHSRFFEYWTLKESYLKALGTGLALPLDSFTFELDRSGRARMYVENAAGAPDTSWRFWQWRNDTHLIALCAERGSPGADVRLREVVPLAGDRPCELRLLRTCPT
jgi:4'-phosphopantetheinyl transferase